MGVGPIGFAAGRQVLELEWSHALAERRGCDRTVISILSRGEDFPTVGALLVPNAADGRTLEPRAIAFIVGRKIFERLNRVAGFRHANRR